MLDLKLLEQGQFVARKETFKTADVFQFVFKIFEFQAKLQDSTISFEAKGNKPLPDSLIGDQIHLKQVLVNLIKNALKFSQRQEIKIQAKYEAREQLLHVAVIDKGRGIKADEMANLFTFFGKIKRTERDNLDGIGMGLTICHKIVERNGGSIDVFSEGENQGSTFLFTMQMKTPEQIANHQSETPNVNQGDKSSINTGHQDDGSKLLRLNPKIDLSRSYILPPIDGKEDGDRTANDLTLRPMRAEEVSSFSNNQLMMMDVDESVSVPA